MSVCRSARKGYPEMCEAMKTLMRDEMMEAQRAGEARGEMNAKKETAVELADMGLPAEKIARAVKVNLETVKGWLSGAPSVAR